MAFIQADFMSKSLMRNVMFSAILPGDQFTFSGKSGKKVREKKPLQTLYLLHGLLGGRLDWVTYTRIRALAQERNLAVIMPSGENSFYVDNPTSGSFFGEFIGRELVSYTRDIFPLSDKREDTFIAGLSMGGYGALRNGLKYSDTFGYAAGLSSALIIEDAVKTTEDAPVIIHRRSYVQSIFGDLDRLIGSDMDIKALVRNLLATNQSIPKLYIACGTSDTLISQNRDFRDFLLENNVEATYEEGPGDHTWDFWDSYIEKVLNWLPVKG